VQMRGRGIPCAAVGMPFNINATYQDVMNEIIGEFKYLDDDSVTFTLLDMYCKEISEQEFSVYGYVKSQQKYVGSTRIYLGVTAVTQPTQSAVSTMPLPLVSPGTQSAASTMPLPLVSPPTQSAASTMPLPLVSPGTQSAASTMPLPLVSPGTQSAQTRTPTQPQTPTQIQTRTPTQSQTHPQTETQTPIHIIQMIKDECAEIENRGDTDLDMGGLAGVDTKQYCPVFASDPRVCFFVSQCMEEVKKVASGWGDFFCISHKMMAELDTFLKESDCTSYIFADETLRFFLSHVLQSEDGYVCVEEVTDGIWKVSQFVGEKFSEWKEHMYNLYRE
jgi:hypothetical protein